MRRRSCAFLVRMNDNELNSLSLNVKKSGLSREEYVRRVLFGDDYKKKPEVKAREKA